MSKHHYFVTDIDGTKYCAFGLIKAESRPDWPYTKESNPLTPHKIWVMVNGSPEIIQNPNYKVALLPYEINGSFWIEHTELLDVVKNTQPDEYSTVAQAIAVLMEGQADRRRHRS